jgi:hypothetical protein
MTDDDPMDVPMFDLPPTPRQPRPNIMCGAVGRRAMFLPWAVDRYPSLADRVPVCNRTLGHHGPHRVYDRSARVRAQWD